MEKNTIVAIVLSSVVLIGGLLLQQRLFPPADPIIPPTPEQISEQSAQQVSASQGGSLTTSIPNETVSIPDGEAAAEALAEQTYIIETELVRVTFTNRGGDIISYELLEHNDSLTGEFVQMADNISNTNRAFSLSFGDEYAPILNEVFSVRQLDRYTIGFFRDYELKNPDGTTSLFTLAKQYSFKPDDYLFQLDVTIDGQDGMRGLNFGNAGYTLRTQPQIGPFYNSKNDRYEYRKFVYYVNEKKKTNMMNPGQTKIIEDQYSWAGVAGKYFTVLGIPPKTVMEKTMYSAQSYGDYANGQLFMVRTPVTQQKTLDTYYFYVGPRTEKFLSVYNSGNNPWRLSELRLNNSLESSGVLSWLETALKWLMELFYKLIPNWGVSIIIITVLVKVLFFPLTKKSSMSTLKMQALQPKIQELQEKYKGSPEKLNMEMAKMYKEAGANPLSGCLPLLIQFPLIIAMYNLFNNYFEFRGAMFIPGWIPDLSMGDSVYVFGFELPFLGNNLRLLPIIYVISQLVYGKVTQTPGSAQQNSTMKIMMYGMPLFFFFIFYNAPSGLLIYWTFSNFLTMIQQIIINKAMHAAKGKEPSGPVIAGKKNSGNLKLVDTTGKKKK
jgi:YidC/Oxa1 family membrane protein insertase